MKLYKDDILKILTKYNFNPNDYIVISGASLVLQNIKEYTSDIDIAVSKKLYNKLLKDYSCTFEKKVDGYDIWFINNIVNFSNHYYDEVEYLELYGYKIQTIESIIKLKQKLNRLNDKKDIQAILNFINKK